MATIRTFEDIEAWQKARILSNKIYELTLNGSFAKDYSLRDQINRSSGSMMDNIAEGFDRSGRKEFIQFLSYAKGSAGEVRSQLYRANDRNHISENEFNDLLEKTIEAGKMIGGLINYLKSSTIKGTKFMEEPTVPYNLPADFSKKTSSDPNSKPETIKLETNNTKPETNNSKL